MLLCARHLPSINEQLTNSQTTFTTATYLVPQFLNSHMPNMGKLNNPTAFTGEEEFPEDTLPSGTRGYNIKSKYIYEGTDSEEEEEIPLKRTLDNKVSSSYTSPGTESGTSNCVISLSAFLF
jgi:hypothetical protein